MNYLITGGAGFIGNHLAFKLSKKKINKVYVIDLSSKIKKIKKISNVSYISGDISNKAVFKKIKAKINIAYHLAAQTSNQVGEENPSLNYNTNVLGTQNFYLWAINNKPQKCYFASSMSIYGQDCQNKKEKSLCEPHSNYGISKLTGELIFKMLNKYKINYVIFRLFNVYGPGQDLNNLKQGMLSIYIAQALKNDFINVTGSLNRIRDFIYIDDVISLFISKKIKNNNIYNIGLGKKVSVSKAINLINQYFNKDLKIFLKKNSPGDIFKSYANIDKLKYLNYKFKVDLKVGIKKTIDSFKK
jgi:UDP-glucose 4-epimerase